jgi:hypothetical protein
LSSAERKEQVTVEIIIRIKNGRVQIEPAGFSGAKCLEATWPYEKDLGAVVERKRKSEFYSGEGVVQSGQKRNRTAY